MPWCVCGAPWCACATSLSARVGSRCACGISWGAMLLQSAFTCSVRVGRLPFCLLVFSSSGVGVGCSSSWLGCVSVGACAIALDRLGGFLCSPTCPCLLRLVGVKCLISFPCLMANACAKSKFRYLVTTADRLPRFLNSLRGVDMSECSGNRSSMIVGSYSVLARIIIAWRPGGFFVWVQSLTL